MPVGVAPAGPGVGGERCEGAAVDREAAHGVGSRVDDPERRAVGREPGVLGAGADPGLCSAAKVIEPLAAIE